MAERKVLTKYVPPDFDPSLIPRRRVTVGVRIRMLLPMTITYMLKSNHSNFVSCVCKETFWRGKILTAYKETMEGDRYLDAIPIYRFTFQCKNCESDILIKTDPANSSYLLEAIRSNLPKDETNTADLPPGVCTKHEDSDALESLLQYEDNNV